MVPEPVVAKANDREEDRGKQANLWMGEPSPDLTASQLMCPSHGKLCKKGIYSGMSRLGKEEGRKKREVESGGGGSRRGGFCLTFGLLVHCSCLASHISYAL